MTAPRLAHEDEDGRRYYRHPRTLEQVPSVTRCIEGGIPKPALVNWAAKMAAEHAVANWLRLSSLGPEDRMSEIKTAHQRYAEKKADLGDIVHKLIECWSTNEPFPELAKEVSSYADSFISFCMAKRPKFIENEVTVWSRTHGYAGTADFIAVIEKKLVLGDTKTGRRLYPETGLQLSALAYADFIIREDGSEEPLPPIEELAALHIRPRSWNLAPVTHAGECFDAFLAAKGVMEWQENVARSVLG